ncbi:MAG: GlsB/YeaQ/YmgE family stress response membrane protein [Candidatus Eremiobacterota bacterium]
MNIIFWIVLGAVSGWIASSIMGQNRSGWIKNTFLGMVGAFVGGFVMNLIGGAGITGFNLYSIFVSVIGAIITVYILGRF